jgi:hypothetical protein
MDEIERGRADLTPARIEVLSQRAVPALKMLLDSHNRARGPGVIPVKAPAAAPPRRVE